MKGFKKMINFTVSYFQKHPYKTASLQIVTVLFMILVFISLVQDKLFFVFIFNLLKIQGISFETMANYSKHITNALFFTASLTGLLCIEVSAANWRDGNSKERRAAKQIRDLLKEEDDIYEEVSEEDNENQ